MSMKLLNTYSTIPEAYIDKGYLEDNGIPAQVEEGAMSEIFPAPGAGSGSISLYVLAKDYDTASKLIFDRKVN